MSDSPRNDESTGENDAPDNCSGERGQLTAEVDVAAVSGIADIQESYTKLFEGVKIDAAALSGIADIQESYTKLFGDLDEGLAFRAVEDFTSVIADEVRTAVGDDVWETLEEDEPVGPRTWTR